MILIVSNKEEKIKILIAAKNKIKLKYKQQLNDIKQHYGIEFDIEHFSNENLKSVVFYNLKYKNQFNNLSITYNYSTKNIDYISYEFSDSRMVKNANHRQILFYLDKEYKIKLLITEINHANEKYKKEIEEMNNKFQISDNISNEFEKTYQSYKIADEE